MRTFYRCQLSSFLAIVFLFLGVHAASARAAPRILPFGSDLWFATGAGDVTRQTSTDEIYRFQKGRGELVPRGAFAELAFTRMAVLGNKLVIFHGSTGASVWNPTEGKLEEKKLRDLFPELKACGNCLRLGEAGRLPNGEFGITLSSPSLDRFEGWIWRENKFEKSLSGMNNLILTDVDFFLDDRARLMSDGDHLWELVDFINSDDRVEATVSIVDVAGKADRTQITFPASHPRLDRPSLSFWRREIYFSLTQMSEDYAKTRAVLFRRDASSGEAFEIWGSPWEASNSGAQNSRLKLRRNERSETELFLSFGSQLWKVEGEGSRAKPTLKSHPCKGNIQLWDGGISCKNLFYGFPMSGSGDWLAAKALHSAVVEVHETADLKMAIWGADGDGVHGNRRLRLKPKNDFPSFASSSVWWEHDRLCGQGPSNSQVICEKAPGRRLFPFSTASRSFRQGGRIWIVGKNTEGEVKIWSRQVGKTTWDSVPLNEFPTEYYLRNEGFSWADSSGSIFFTDGTTTTTLSQGLKFERGSSLLVHEGNTLALGPCYEAAYPNGLCQTDLRTGSRLVLEATAHVDFTVPLLKGALVKMSGNFRNESLFYWRTGQILPFSRVSGEFLPQSGIVSNIQVSWDGLQAASIHLSKYSSDGQGGSVELFLTFDGSLPAPPVVPKQKISSSLQPTTYGFDDFFFFRFFRNESGLKTSTRGDDGRYRSDSGEIGNDSLAAAFLEFQDSPNRVTGAWPSQSGMFLSTELGTWHCEQGNKLPFRSRNCKRDPAFSQGLDTFYSPTSTLWSLTNGTLFKNRLPFLSEVQSRALQPTLDSVPHVATASKIFRYEDGQWVSSDRPNSMAIRAVNETTVCAEDGVWVKHGSSWSIAVPIPCVSMSDDLVAVQKVGQSTELWTREESGKSLRLAQVLSPDCDGNSLGDLKNPNQFAVACAGGLKIFDSAGRSIGEAPWPKGRIVSLVSQIRRGVVSTLGDGALEYDPSQSIAWTYWRVD